MNAQCLGFSLLTVVAFTKTLLTKFVFEHVATPVAFSTLSCIVTWLVLSPTFACARFAAPDPRNIDGLLLASVMISMDLAFANIALSKIAVSTQQCIRATAPAFTMLIEALVHRRRFRPLIVTSVMGICIGPIVMSFETVRFDSREMWGSLSMILSVMAGAVKNVVAHDVIGSAKHSMGILAFTWWVELFVGLLLLPWSLWYGEAALLLRATEQMRLLTVFTAAYGGVRILSQFYFLKHTSPTTLALSNIAVQVLTTVGGIVLFHEPTTGFIIVGIVITMVMSIMYTALKMHMR